MKTPTKRKSSLNYSCAVLVKNPRHVLLRLEDFVESKLHRGYRLRFGQEGQWIRLDHDNYQQIQTAISYLNAFREPTQPVKKFW